MAVSLLSVKLEYVTPTDSDDCVYWQMRDDPPVYINLIGKEDYLALDPSFQHPFVTGMFDIKGITEVSVTAHRVAVMKSPAYNWGEVNANLTTYLLAQFSKGQIDYLAGSANADGTGFRLSSSLNRRAL